jgi:hypothetical protein
MRKLNLQEKQLDFINLILSQIQKAGEQKGLVLKEVNYFKHKNEAEDIFVNTELTNESYKEMGWFCFQNDGAVYDLLERFPENEDKQAFIGELEQVEVIETLPLSKVVEIEAFVTELFKDDVDKANAPYVEHLKRVASNVSGNVATVVALLHDTVEDKQEWTLARLQEEFRLPDEVLIAVNCMTHKEGDSYATYLANLIQNPTARVVKQADLEDNMDITRLEYLTTKDLKRLNKYLLAYRIVLCEDEAKVVEMLKELEVYG